MFKSRKYLVGLGTGLIIAAILVQLAHIGEAAELGIQPTTTPASNQSAEPWTLEQLEKEAKKLDHVVLTNEKYQSLLAAKAEPSVATGTTKPQPDVTAPLIYIYIYQGMTSDSIEEYLYLAGIINDRVAFREKIRSEGLTDKLKANLYSFTPGMKMDQVIDKLTGVNP
ncbi:MAG: endolytic transglycosylase MltG [Gorillibacterium sp.]|nr:endolytic transglycosylase MltG [Gorillibacterium sp.]